MKNFIYLFILCWTLFSSCRKWIEPNPPGTQLLSTQVFASEATATAALLSIYSQMETDGLAYDLIINTGRSADELKNYSTASSDVEFASNNLTAANRNVDKIWGELYNYIYKANALLEGLGQDVVLDTTIRHQLEAEAYFVRGFCHFYLLQIFGPVPVLTNTDYQYNATSVRQPVSTVTKQIVDDLNMALRYLSDDYLDGTNNPSSERVRPNKFAAAALLAKLYVFLEDWQKAEEMSSLVIANTSLYALQPDLNQAFLKNNTEAVWQWESQVPGYNAYPGAFLILTARPRVVALDTAFIKLFPADDLRRKAWIDSIIVGGQTYYYPYKYKQGQNSTSILEYSTVLRLSEQYLIRAEARAMQGRLSEAVEDLNLVHQRAGLAAYAGLDQATLLGAIYSERQRELFSEFGDRWFNLKRTGLADRVLSSVKGSDWNSEDALYPIPFNEIQLNPNLVQNPGY